MTFVFWERGKPVRITQEEVTAWVLPCRSVDDRPLLQVMGIAGKKMRVTFTLGHPEDWEPWDAEMIRKLEEYERQKVSERTAWRITCVLPRSAVTW